MKSACMLFSISLVIIFGFLAAEAGHERDIVGSAGSKISVEQIRQFDEPWAMTFLPDGRMLVSEKKGRLLLVKSDGSSAIPVDGIPEVAYGGQGGFGDVILHPQFTENGHIYISYAEEVRPGERGAVVARGRLALDGQSASLADLIVIWRQLPAVTGRGHYSHRLGFGPDGMLYISSGDRQKEDPAQSYVTNLGKILRLKYDGSVPADNPFQDKGELARTFYTMGHRNVLGLAFDDQGRLWANEMGPRHGDEFNLIVAGENYGWPEVSWGNHYSGFPIADHDTRPEFRQPAAYWVPSIAPSGLILYTGSLFPQWRGNALMGGLVSQSLIRVVIEGDTAREVERFAMGNRIREIEQGPDGTIWLLEDKADAWLLRLTPGK